ncbi:MAG TPA: hypothetical protein VIE39_07040 [Thermoanaerobaculia bacterium]
MRLLASVSRLFRTAASRALRGVCAPESGKVRQLRLVTNWFTELERLAPRGKEK